MKTVNLERDNEGSRVTIELNEFELTALVALVEQGSLRLSGRPRRPALSGLHARMVAIADEFCDLLGRLEPLSVEK